MKVEEYLVDKGWAQADLARRLGISRAAVSKWSEIPEKHLKELSAELPEGIAERDWWVSKDKLCWGVMGLRGLEVKKYGHGSGFDYDYSMAQIDHIRQLLALHGSSGAVFAWVNPVAFPQKFIEDVKKDIVCPRVVDMMKPRIKGGRPVPKVVYPFGEV